MWRQIVKHKKMLLAALIGLAAGCALGVLVGLAIHTSQPDSMETGRVGIQMVLPTTAMARRVEFKKCGHTRDVALLNEAFIGYTEEELAAFYKTCQISEFSKERVIISQTLDTCCPEHVLLRERSDGTLCVYQTDGEFYIEQLIRVLPLNAREDLGEEEHAQLQGGMVFDTLAGVDAYLEGLDS